MNDDVLVAPFTKQILSLVVGSCVRVVIQCAFLRFRSVQYSTQFPGCVFAV